MGWHDVLLRLTEAFALGSMIGAERQWRHHMAGLQTNVLVAVGAASFVLIAAQDVGDASGLARIAAQVASGIGFLGAGVIMRQGLNVHGLNTAATLWCSGAVGTLAGAGQALTAASAALFVVLANLVLHRLVALINRQSTLGVSDLECEYLVSLVCRSADESRIRALLLQGTGGLAVHALDSRRHEFGDRVEVAATFLSLGRDDQAIEQMVARLGLDPSISAARWRLASRPVGGSREAGDGH